MKFLMALFGSIVFSVSALANPFDGVNETTPKCYERSYSIAHLNKHPRQTVKAIHMTLLGFEFKGEKQRFLDIAVKLKKPKHGRTTFRTTMICMEDGLCFIECDGGQAKIAERNGELIFKNKGITLVGGCGGDLEEEEIEIFLKPTKNGDDVFTLKPAKECKIPKWFTEIVDGNNSAED